jgi:hypothetical protein
MVLIPVEKVTSKKIENKDNNNEFVQEKEINKL